MWRFGSHKRRASTGWAALSVRYVMASTTPTGSTTQQGNPGKRYVGSDDQGRELEVIAVEMDTGGDETLLLVIHVMPTQLRGGGQHE